MEEPGGLQSMRSQRVGHDWATSLYYGQRRHSRWDTNLLWNASKKGKVSNQDREVTEKTTLATKVHLVKAMVFPVVMYGCKSWTIKKLSAEELMLLNCGVGEDSWESLGLQRDPTSPSWLGDQSWIFIGRTDAEAEIPILWPPDVKNWLIGKDPDAGKDWRQEEGLTGWDGWMASLTQRTWVWASSRSLWSTGRPRVLQSIGLQRVADDWVTELNWKHHGLSWGPDPCLYVRMFSEGRRRNLMMGFNGWINNLDSLISLIFYNN